MNGEIINALFSLLNQRIAINFPGEVFGNATYFFERLINRHRTNRHRAVTQNPFASSVDVFAGREIHNRIRTPTRRPDHLFDFFFDGGGDRRVADIRIDLHQEVPSDNHRLRFRVVDVIRDDRPARCNLITHKFRRNQLRNFRAEGVAALRIWNNFLKPKILARGDIFHFRRNNSCPCICELRHNLSSFRT